ncbi:MAG TPA: class II aldolase/adducin family protein [Beijerinckiaceae bacterium]
METSERMLREEVAACTLMLNDEGLMGYSGHVSARLPGEDAYLIQPKDVSRAGLRPDDLLVCDYDGRVLRGASGVSPPAEVFLHGEILRARPDVNAIAHFHHDLTNSFTLVEDLELVPVKNHALRWRSGIPVHPDPSHVSDSALGRAVAATLGPHHAMQIRAHGQIVAAESVRALLIDSVHFVENATAMHHACVIGRLKPLSEDDMTAFARAFKRATHISKLWTYYVGRARAKGVLPPEWAID